MKFAKCVDCGWTTDKPVKNPNSNLRTCKGCKARGTLQATGEDVQVAQETQVESSPLSRSEKGLLDLTQQAAQESDDDSEDVIEFTIDEEQPENSSFNIPANTQVQNATLHIPVSKGLVKKMYKVIDGIGQDLEKAVFDRESKFYGSATLKAIYEINSELLSKMSNKIRLPVKEFFLLSHIPIFGGILAMGATWFSKKRKKSKEELKEQEAEQYV